MPETMVKPLPFEKAIAFFRDKVVLTPDKFNSLTAEARSKAFSVSGISKMNILEDVFTETERGLSEGISFGEWKKGIKDVMAKRGWEGAAPYRLDTIFRNNIQTAYQAGHYQHQMDVAEDLPYWEYVAVMDSRTRPAHRAMNGKVFRYDDDFWKTSYPPNGFNCFPNGSLVATNTGFKKIEDIISGELVIGGSGKFKPVMAIHKAPFNGNLVRLVSKGLEARMTPNHRILTLDGWKRAESIKVGDVLVQIREIASLNNSIVDINKPDACGSNSVVSFPRQRESSIRAAFDAELNIGKKKINPVSTEPVIKGKPESGIFQELIHDLLALRKLHFCVGMSRRIGSEPINLSLRKLLSYFRASCSSSDFKLFRAGINGRVGFFGLAKSWMKSLCVSFSGYFTKKLRLLDLSIFRIDPLGFYCLAATAGNDSIVLHQSHESAGIDIPEIANLPVRKASDEVVDGEGFTDGAPLDAFYSLDDFNAWAFSHCDLRKVELIERIPYTGNVFNLSVAGDESYCIPLAVVHNCRCTVRALTEGQVKREKLAVDRNGMSMADKGWDVNPGEAMGRTLPADQFKKLQSDPGRWAPLIKKGYDSYGLQSVRDFKDYKKTDTELWTRGNKAIEMYKENLLGKVFIDAVNDPLIMNEEFINHLKLDGRERFLPLIEEIVSSPKEIWLQAEKEKLTGKVVLRKRYISLIQTEKERPLLMVAEGSKGQWLSYTVLQPGQFKYVDSIRNGVLFYGE